MKLNWADGIGFMIMAAIGCATAYVTAVALIWMAAYWRVFLAGIVVIAGLVGLTRSVDPYRRDP
jgi:hypothetical protein